MHVQIHSHPGSLYSTIVHLTNSYRFISKIIFISIQQFSCLHSKMSNSFRKLPYSSSNFCAATVAHYVMSGLLSKASLLTVGIALQDFFPFFVALFQCCGPSCEFYSWYCFLYSIAWVASVHQVFFEIWNVLFKSSFWWVCFLTLSGWQEVKCV